MSVVTVTGTRVGSPGVGAGTPAVHTSMLAQLTGAGLDPNVTLIRPLGL